MHDDCGVSDTVQSIEKDAYLPSKWPREGGFCGVDDVDPDIVNVMFNSGWKQNVGEKKYS